MNFLNPIVLIGLAAAGIPILLHLLNLRKLKTVEFSTLRFLKELQKTKIRRLKLKRIILLILRILIIIFAVMAFARPTIESSIPGFESFSKTSAVILIDNSFSMDVSDENGNRFNQAKLSALSVLNGLRNGDEAVIIPMTEVESITRYNFSGNLELLKSEVSDIEISYKSANIENSLRLASAILDEALNLNKEIYIISDYQDNIFRGETTKNDKLINKKISVYLMPAGYNTEADIQNISVDSVNLISRIFRPGKPIEIEATLKNHSASNMNGVIVSMFFNRERVAGRSIDIPAGSFKTVAIAASPSEGGVYSASVETENDALDYDNKRYFGFVIPEFPRIAVFGKNKNFLKMAIDGAANGLHSHKTEYFGENEFSAVNLNNYELIFASVSSYSDSDISRLLSFIKNGGRAFLFATENTDIISISGLLSQAGIGNIKDIEFSKDNPAVFSETDKQHPLFEGVFKGSTDSKKNIETAKIYKAYPVESATSIIKMPGGSFLTEGFYGEGKIIYCAVAPDNTLSNFALTGLFPSLIYKSIYYLNTTNESGLTISAGESPYIQLPKKYSAGGIFKIIYPDNTETETKSYQMPGGAIINPGILERSGNYIIKSLNGEAVNIISVNHDNSESDLAKSSDDELKSRMSEYIGGDSEISIININDDIQKELVRVRTGTELWQFFLMASILCAIAEMLVARNTKSETNPV